MAKYIPETFIDTLLARVNIVDIIGEYVPLKRSGTYYSGLCPFHADSNPSFKVNIPRQFFYCYGCHKGGNAITFLMEYHGYSFVEAVEALADSVGETVPYKETSRSSSHLVLKQKKGFFEINKIATDFYKKKLRENENALLYLKKRGFTEDIIEKFSIGFAPPSFDALTKLLKSYSIEVCENAEKIGLLSYSREGNFYDKFRNRIMFPIFNTRGEVVGFSGRSLIDADDIPKYLNSPDSKIFHKGKLLYGLHQARQKIVETKQVIVVEGNVDVISMHKAGFEQTCAPLGTGFTIHQALLLKRLAETIILMFDGDDAGKKAIHRSIKILLDIGVHPMVAPLPEGTDPDSIINDEGAEKIKFFLEKSVYGLDFLINTYIIPHIEDPVLSSKGLDLVLPLVMKIENPAQKDFYLKKLSRVLNLTRDQLLNYSHVLKTKTGTKRNDKRHSSGDSYFLKGVLLILTHILEFPDLISYLDDEFLKVISEEEHGDLLIKIKQFVEAHGKIKPDFLMEIENYPGYIKEKIADIFIDPIEINPVSLEESFVYTLRSLEKHILDKKLKKLTSTMKKKGGMNHEVKKELLEEISRILLRRKDLELFLKKGFQHDRKIN